MKLSWFKGVFSLAFKPDYMYRAAIPHAELVYRGRNPLYVDPVDHNDLLTLR